MTAGLALAAVVVSAFAVGRWGRWCTIPLLVSALLWLHLNKTMEGPVLVQVSTGHGLVATDLAGIAGVGVAVLALGLGGRPRR